MRLEPCPVAPERPFHAPLFRYALLCILMGGLATARLLATNAQMGTGVVQDATGFRSKNASKFILISPLPNSMTAYIGGSIE